MELLISTALGILASASVIGTTIYVLNKRRRSLESEVATQTQALVDTTERDLIAVLPDPKRFASKRQIEALEEQIREITSALESERTNLERIEKTLEDARREVELKEGEQQRLKITQEEDERLLAELLEASARIQEECRLLEENLANSLKRLDQVLEEFELTTEQRQILQAFSANLEQASGLLLELISEHKTLLSKLTSLRGQLGALEEEYTRLVEQQLAG